jgi:hypothetical protein
MTLIEDIAALKKDRYLAVILDNEVTVGEFVVDPPLPWSRLVQNEDAFKIADGYPTTLTATQAKFEMKNWDVVSLRAIVQLLQQLSDAVDMMVFGNNAGQGLPLAQALPESATTSQGAVIYAATLPEKSAYERLGYRNFWRRSDTAHRLLDRAQTAGRPLMLFFINTIQHNELNYHDP